MNGCLYCQGSRKYNGNKILLYIKLASNAIFRKIAYLAEIPYPEFLLNACW